MKKRKTTIKFNKNRKHDEWEQKQKSFIYQWSEKYVENVVGSIEI